MSNIRPSDSVASEVGPGGAGILGALNFTTLLSVLDSLRPDELQVLYKELGVNSTSAIREMLNGFGISLDNPSLSTGVDIYEQQLMKYPEYRLNKLLLYYVPPILLFLGTLGNLMSFIILMNRTMRKFSTYIYLAVLSLTDILVLYVGLLSMWVGELTSYYVRDQSDWSCKIFNVLGCTVSDYSVWLIIAVTVERYIAVCHPLKAPVICTRSHFLRVVPTLGVILFATNSHFIWTVHISMAPFQGKEIPQCREKDAFKTLVTEIWPWVDAFIYSFLPFVVISVMNSRIIYSVVIARRGRDRMQSGGQSTLKKPTNPSNGVRRTTNGQTQGGGGQQDTSYRLTFMLLTISCTFLLTTLPVNIIGICAKFLNPKDLAIVTKFKLARTIAELLMYCNHSMNFFLYCATGQKFRQQLLMLICRRRDRSRFTSPSTKIYKSTMNTTIYKQKPKTSIIGSDEKKSLTSHTESKEHIIDNTTPDEIELKRTLQPEKVPRYTTLAVNKNNYQYT